MLAVALAVLLAATPHEVHMNHVRYEDLKDKTVPIEEALAAKTPSELSFALIGAPQLDAHGYLRLRGALKNPTAHAVSVVGFPAGHGPFFAEIASPEVTWYRPDDPERPKDLPPPMPPAPPPPVQFTVPAQTEVAFEYGVWLKPLKWHGAPRVKVKWTFLFWNEPKPKGEVEVTLPRRP